MKVEDIKATRRFKRVLNTVKIPIFGSDSHTLYAHPVRDIAYNYTFYVIHNSMTAVLLYGDDPKTYEKLDVDQSQIFVMKHNEVLLKEIIEKDQAIKGDFLLVDGLIVYEPAVTQLQADMNLE